jgi:glutamate synthase domain-containing protein 3
MVVLGTVGTGIGESMYDGVIHVRDPQAGEKLGGNVMLVDIADGEKKEVAALFEKYGIEADPGDFKSIVPKVYGRHEYELFKPTHKRAGAKS